VDAILAATPVWGIYQHRHHVIHLLYSDPRLSGLGAFRLPDILGEPVGGVAARIVPATRLVVTACGQVLPPDQDLLVAGGAGDRVAPTACGRTVADGVIIEVITAGTDAGFKAGSFVECLAEVDSEDDVDVVLTVTTSDVVHHLTAVAVGGATVIGQRAGLEICCGKDQNGREH